MKKNEKSRPTLPPQCTAGNANCPKALLAKQHFSSIVPKTKRKEFSPKMKRLLLCGLLALLLPGCRSTVRQTAQLPENLAPCRNYTALFESPDSGTTLVYGSGMPVDFRVPPCSTFKIVSTLMGLDAGVVKDQHTRLGYDGTRHEIAAWNHDVTLAEAFRSSCVPYYKALTGKLDKSYVRNILKRLHYGNADLAVWNSNGHNVFWIESSLLISPAEQVRVLEKIFSGRSGFRPEHVALLKSFMALGNAGKFTLYGKTGTGRNHNTNRLEAWFVGFAEAPDGSKLFFAARGTDPERNVASAEIRESVRQLLATEFSR